MRGSCTSLSMPNQKDITVACPSQAIRVTALTFLREVLRSQLEAERNLLQDLLHFSALCLPSLGETTITVNFLRALPYPCLSPEPLWQLSLSSTLALPILGDTSAANLSQSRALFLPKSGEISVSSLTPASCCWPTQCTLSSCEFPQS